MSTEGLRVLVPRAAYALALIAAVAWAYLLLAASASNGTLGFDYRAYDLAVDNLFAGRSMYDPNATETGAFGLFFYPPPFALLVAPIALLPGDTGVWVWTLLLIAASVAAVALMPVTLRVRLAILLLAALSWPLLYAVKLGQVGPLILLLMAIGWRWLDRGWPLGLSIALGAAIKLQPALLFGWTVLTGRLRAAVVGLVVFALLAVIATAIAGQQSWFQELDLLSRVSKPVLTPNAVGVGRLLYQAGVSESVATIANYANLIAVGAVALFATLRASAVASYLAVAVASHFISPVLWDHYALILLLPVAWLLDRGRWLAALIPLVTATPLVGITPTAAYPIVFWVTLLAITWEGVRARRETDRAGATNLPLQTSPVA